MYNNFTITSNDYYIYGILEHSSNSDRGRQQLHESWHDFRKPAMYKNDASF